tara:strand:- start:508 stop:675 length:168 start_codon:yes stop_codon:yes gene_type:complete
MMSSALIHSALLVPGDVSGNPITHSLIVYIGEFGHEMLVGVEVIGELVGVHLNEP